MPRSKPSCRAMAGLVALASTASSAVAALDASLLVSRYGMNISECDGILISETSQDFGPPLTSDESADLWNEATEWQWTIAAADAHAAHPFIVCDASVGLSGYRRRKKMNETMGDAILMGDTTVYNSDDMSCFMTSSDANALANVLEEMPEGLKNSLKVQPMLPSFKILGGTVSGVEQWIESAGPPTEPSVVVSRGSDGVASEESTEVAIISTTVDHIQRLRLDISICPAAVDKLFWEVESDIVSYLTGNDGDAVTTNSFFYGKPSVTDRMDFWSKGMNAAVQNKEQCFSALQQQGVLEGETFPYGSMSVLLPTREMGAAWEDCVWYALRGLALHPLVCRLEHFSDVTVLPPPDDPGVVVGTVPTEPGMVTGEAPTSPMLTTGADPINPTGTETTETTNPSGGASMETTRASTDPSDLSGTGSMGPESETSSTILARDTTQSSTVSGEVLSTNGPSQDHMKSGGESGEQQPTPAGPEEGTEEVYVKDDNSGSKARCGLPGVVSLGAILAACCVASL